jgi:hypothetical protein
MTRDISDQLKGNSMKQLHQSELEKISGGTLDGVSCECWKMIGLMGFLVAYQDITLDVGLLHVDLACTEEEQDLAIELARPYLTK